MDSIRKKIVTAKSLEPPPFQAGESESIPGMATDDGQLRLQRYAQIMERLQQEGDELGSDVMVTAQDREVSLAQSKLAEEVEAARDLPSGGQEVQFGTGFSGGDWFRWVWSLTDWVDRKDAHPMLRPSTNTAGRRGQTICGSRLPPIGAPASTARRRSPRPSAGWPVNASSISRCTWATSTTRARRRKSTHAF